MKIGLIFPNQDRRYKTVHLGLALIAAYARLHHDDLEFQVLDTRVATRKETIRFLNTRFDLVGITVYSPVYFEVKKIFNTIRKNHPTTLICLGGPYVTTIREEIFNETPADFAIYGEGEITFSELIASIKGLKSIDSINGLMYKIKNGELIVNPEREQIKDIDSLPIPAYDLFPMNRYPLHRMVTSRGCPYSCAWCNSSSLWKKGTRYMSPEKMILEIEYLIEHYGKKLFIFGDNSFNVPLNRIDQFCDLLIDKKLDILWAVSYRADYITKEIAQKLKKAGCYNVSIGIESANNEILEKIGKGTTIEKVSEGIRILKEAGIEIMSQFVIGSPFETLENVKESIVYAKNSGCDYTNFYTVLPFKGTPQWDYVQKHGTLLVPLIHNYHSIEPRIVFETPEFPYKDRVEAIRLVKKEGFYSNQDKKNILFDVAKNISEWIQRMLPKSVGEKIYLVLKSIYRLKIVKKNNR